ncbi:MAG: glycosyltransferase family 4 protein [Spirulina sp.]
MKMRWLIASPILTQPNPEPFRYIENLLRSDHHVTKIVWRKEPYINYTNRTNKYTSLGEWLTCFKQAFQLLTSQDSDGVITLLVQLPTAMGLLKRLPFMNRKPVVALDFTIAHLRGGIHQKIARFALAKIDRFGVFCQHERKIYSEYLGLPIERFDVLYQYYDESGLAWQEDNESPFVIALGSALRDYPTFIQAIEKLKLPAVIASSRPALKEIEIPKHVQTPFDINRYECWEQIAKARIDVVPLQITQDTSSAGFRAIVEAMEIGCPLVVTQGAGAEDYVIHRETGLLIEPNSVDSMAEAILLLWNDAELRQYMSQAARAYAKEHFSPEARGRAMERVLNDFLR